MTIKGVVASVLRGDILRAVSLAGGETGGLVLREILNAATYTYNEAQLGLAVSYLESRGYVKVSHPQAMGITTLHLALTADGQDVLDSSKADAGVTLPD